MFEGLITVRSLSSRLPGKCFLSFGTQTVLDHVIKRSKFYNINPTICTTKDKSDDKIIEIAKKHKIKYFRGSSNNKIKRWCDCANYFKIKFFHTIDADDLFFCGNEMISSINFLKNNNKFDIIFPSKLSASGSAFVGYSFTLKSINKLSKSIPVKSDTEMIEPYIKKNKDLNYSVFRNPTQYGYKARMTLDYIEDYLFLDKIRSKLKPFPKMKNIYELLKGQPTLTNLNIKQNSLWKKNQQNKIKSII